MRSDVTLLITGCAGFIGSRLALDALEKGYPVVGVDNLNFYYSEDLKLLRLNYLQDFPHFSFYKGDINDLELFKKLCQKFEFTSVYHLAAQAGVRLPPSSYGQYSHSNIDGFTNVLNFAIDNRIPNFIYASSSSVYGNSPNMTLSENDHVNTPTSYYGATKVFNELAAQIMIKNSETKARGLRFFTVYGEFGRPDMAYFRIANSIINNKKFMLFGDGKIQRDFTHVDDIINATLLLGHELSSRPAGFADVVNIGGGKPVSISDLIEVISGQLGKKPLIEYLESNKSDVASTSADSKYLASLVDFVPQISIEVGIDRFLKWARSENIQGRLINWVDSSI